MMPVGGKSSILRPQNTSEGYSYAIQYDSGGENIRATVNASARFDTSSTPNFASQWAHMCMTYDGSAVILYKDGEEVGRIDATGALQQNDISLSIGGRLESGQNFIGTIDDVRLYSHALTVEEIQAVMIGEGSACSLGPDPADGAFHADTWVNLSWSPGEYVVSHDVYLGADVDAVKNADKTSEATLTLSERDWTAQAVMKLALWFHGDSGNAADRMFVALGNAVVYHDDPAATQIAGWNEWVIDLQVFTDQGVALTNVNTITIGFGTKNSPAAGGTGTMYFDDIRLVR